jgi:hypothetical protein
VSRRSRRAATVASSSPTSSVRRGGSKSTSTVATARPRASHGPRAAPRRRRQARADPDAARAGSSRLKRARLKKSPEPSAGVTGRT